MDKVRDLRQRAKECLDAAAGAPTADMRARYEDLARTWMKLADERLAFFLPAEDRIESGESVVPQDEKQ